MNESRETQALPFQEDSRRRRAATAIVARSKNLGTIWRRIIEPADGIQDDDLRRQSRLLSALVLAVLAAGVVILPIWVYANPQFPEALYISIGIVGVLGAAYSLSRTRLFHLALFILISFLPGVVAAVIITAPGPMTERMLALDLLIVAILLASIFLSTRTTLIFVVISLVLISLFFFVPDVPFAVTYSYVIYIGIISALLVVTTVIRNDYSRRLRRSEHRYRSLFEQSNDAVFILDLNGVHLEVNQRAADMLGYTPAEIAGLSFREIVAPSEQPQSEDVLRRLLVDLRVPPYERLFRKKDGTDFPVEINAELVRDGAGNPLHIQSIVRDIAERKRAQAQAFSLAIEQERVRILTQFVQKSSHEFRTPLSILSANLYLLSKASDDQKRQDYAERAEYSIDRLTRLLDMMLRMTKLDSNIPFKCRPTGIDGLMRMALTSALRNAEVKKLSMALNLSAALPPVYADESWLAEAVGHLLDNAVRFTPEGGTIFVSTYFHSGHVVVEIRDTGVGIGEEALGHIFERFWRSDEASSTSGFGLGLPIAQRIVERHGGTIEVESVPGGGSVFKIILPIMGSDQAPEQAASGNCEPQAE